MKLKLTVLASILALSACAGNNANQAVQANAQGELPLKIGYTAPGAGYADLYVSADHGIFKKHGLNVELVRLNDSSQLVAGLTSGSVQVGVGVGQDTAAAIMKGTDLRYVAMSEAHYNLELWATPDITKVEDLKGKKVAITSPGSQSDFGLTALLEKHGLTRNDVTGVFVKSIPAEVAALQSGAVSALLTQPPQGTETREKGAVRVATLTDLEFPLGMYTVQGKFLDSNREAVRRFVQAEADALKFLRGNEKETLQSIQKYTGIAKPDLAKYAYDFFLGVWQDSPEVDEKIVRMAFEEAAEIAKTQPPQDVGKYIDNKLLGGA
ncbi:ABC transporter substrate-binding protein [Kibdelosporangium philippinense]|uniref:ABC transporter substrate-binding protein n=1 Tax=Kibdelosporangium philippinense TaxID=211113 RepID=A0ABS8Z296_9PSEU|nr:ABC transporter substrate-binding protein [Kibdelosporangium philippinense]MCE7002061.1 ABC transporter substrate-binding protein [Kibdelosporangium philippinense]